MNIQDTEQQAYGYWLSVGAWVAMHPKTATAIAIVMFLAGFTLGRL